MKFGLFLPGRGMPASAEMASAKVLSRIAVLAEEAGFDGVALDEHPAAPETWRQVGNGHDTIDPFVGLAAVAAATQRVQLITYLAVAPFRNPFVTAKAAATLDVVSEGRCILGLAGGYLEEEFAAIGVDFQERNELFDEALEVIRQVWTGEPVEYVGRHFEARGIRSLPTPHAGRAIPIWVGGNAKRALRRAAAGGHGWVTMPNPRNATVSRHTAPMENLKDLTSLITALEQYTAEAGRAGEYRDVVYPLGTSVRLAGSDLEEVELLGKIGVNWCSVVRSPNDYDEAARAIEKFATDVIEPSRRC